MKQIKIVRTAPRDAYCSQCKGITRNVASMSIGHGRHIESYVCDDCLMKVPNARVVASPGHVGRR